MTATTTDPVVAALYGAMAHQSLAAGVVAAVDLVADQAGPWTLSDTDRADLAADLVDRLRGDPPVQGADAPRSVVAAVSAAQVLLLEAWTDRHDDWPPHLRHEVEDLEARMATFARARTDADLYPATPPSAEDQPEIPSPDVAATYTTADWMLLLQRLGVSIPDAKKALTARAEAVGHTAPRTMRDLEIRPDLVGHLLDFLHDHTGATS